MHGIYRYYEILYLSAIYFLLLFTVRYGVSDMLHFSSKRGFTIIEIAIALIVISILAAIFIPSFLNVGVNADVKADRANCDGINIAIDSAETLENVSKDIHELRAFLQEGGYAPDSLTMLIPENCLVWDKSLNRALIVEIESETVLYPERYANETNTGDWYDIALTQRFPCPEVEAREEFVKLVQFYRGELENAPEYTGEQAGKRYAILVAEMRAVFRGYDKSAVCYAVYDSENDQLLTQVLKGYQVAKRTYDGTIPLGEFEFMVTDACTIVEIANEEGYVIDFFNGYLGNTGENQHYFYSDGRLGGELDTVKYVGEDELIFDSGVYIFPYYPEFIVNEGKNYTTSYFSVEILPENT